MDEASDWLILGAGIAGLTAGRELARQGYRVTVVEQAAEVGGLARTVEMEGFRFDLGGHRFHSHNPSVVRWLQALLGDDLLTVPRVSHIYLNGRYVDYPLKLPGALSAFPPRQAAGMALDYLLARWTERGRQDRSFEDWVIRRFGRQMYRQFFQPYTEKVWGIPADQLSAEWAAQRIGLPSLWQAFRQALRPAAIPPPTAISHFYYPRRGFGLIPQALAREFQALGGVLLTGVTPTALMPQPDGWRLALAEGGGVCQAAQLISTIPLPALLALWPPETGSRALAERMTLTYRGLVCVCLALNKSRVGEDSWTYFPDARLIFGRTHEPKNWSAAMTPDPDATSLCVEIFTDPQAAEWQRSDSDLQARVVQQLHALGWLTPADVRYAKVVRVRHAYPVYHVGYRAQLEAAQAFLGQWPRLHLLGRTGTFRYMNSDGVIEEVFDFLRRLHLAGGEVHRPAVADRRWV